VGVRDSIFTYNGRLERRAAAHDSRIVSIGQLVLFSSESGDAWMLDPSEHLAVRLASEGQPEPIHIEDTETTFTVAWTGQYGIVGPAFLYTDPDSRRVTTTFGSRRGTLLRWGRLARPGTAMRSNF
jgi:hypothetical protein